MKAPTAVEVGCGLALAVVAAAGIAASVADSHATPAPYRIQQCITAQAAGQMHPERTGTCQVGSVRNQ